MKRFALTISLTVLLLTGLARVVFALDTLPPSALELTAVYTFAPTTTAAATGDTTPEAWTLGRDGRAGRQRRYPLLHGNRIRTYATPAEVREASLTARTRAVLWLARHAEETEAEQPYGYTLVVIGAADPLLDLQIGFTRPLTDILAAERIPDEAAGLDRCVRRGALPVTALAPAATVTAVRLEARLVAGDGSLLPLDITAVDYFPTLAEAERFYRCPGLALHALRRPAQAGYALHMVLNEEGAGPPGPQWRPRCRNWLGTNWWSRFLRFFYRC
ncbi:MAG: hypothetical protein N2383_12915 [Caldilineales bacterium]|nr:hypothetical protein [Caldilineales bacterium]